jgi:hypothetical protein
MSIHDQLCLRRRPRLAVWGGILFGIFGISEVFSLHHRFGTSIISRLGYLAVTVCFLCLVTKARCAIERVILIVLSAISAVAFCASILGAETFFRAKLTIMCGWFLAAAACGFWALYARRDLTGR